LKLGIIVNINDPETTWNALRLGNEPLSVGNEVSMFLLGSGVEIENIKDEAFDIASALRKFPEGGGKLMACGICLSLRHQGVGLCPISTMAELVEMISNSHQVVTFG
jgi:uncharacterized protein involved in oxidation of intracellular sulfur